MMPVAETSAASNNPAKTRPDAAAAAPRALDPDERFSRRHIGPNPSETAQMLPVLGFADIDALIDAAVPKQIRMSRSLQLPAGKSEAGVLAELKDIASKNKVYRSFIGMGYHDCVTPPVIQRNVLENPGWYTPYTPYQAEIAQGRLEALLNFQTMVSDLTAMDIANASLLDEATAAAEAMHLCHNLHPDRNVFFVSANCHPQTIAVVKTRARALGIEVQVGDHRDFQFSAKVFGALVQYPDTFGAIHDYSGFGERAHAAGALLAVAADLLALTLLKPPGEFGADIALGSAQRFGVPLGFGGPHAAFFATRDAYKRHLPGRIVGVSKDSRGRLGLRLSLQTREQHIRREKATSNICTAQALLANMASFYAVYHGPEGLKAIAARVHQRTGLLAAALEKLGHKVVNNTFFDTLTLKVADAEAIHKRADDQRVNLRRIDSTHVGISLDETITCNDIEILVESFGGTSSPTGSSSNAKKGVAGELQRTSAFLSHPVFNRYHSETEMLRYIKRLESRDLSLTTSMIPLGSCTMKLNAAVEMFPVSWPEFAKLHPFAPPDQTQGYRALFQNLEDWLAEITGFAGVSLQPNAGSQGEYAGLLVIREYHESRRQGHRNICLIPQSAHGTNPASAVMAGMKVVPVACDSQGNINVADLKDKAAAHANDLAALMITYPSTHGVFEESIKDICAIVHANGGQVYMDGANMNAQVGLCRPADLGADVCHLNLHKTFCIPHGGGGPGMGPIGVAKHLVEFLPGHPCVPAKSALQPADGTKNSGSQDGSGSVPPLPGERAGVRASQNTNLPSDGALGTVSAAPWGSAGILPISWVYIAAMGAEGLTDATKFAILNANYIAHRLEQFFPVLYKGQTGLVAHECILDLRQFKSVTVEDVAKRLMDYGFHAPTISWPVPGTMMVEPTESESKAELDRFCEAMIGIHAEIKTIESGEADSRDNLLKNAPHTADMIAADKWEHPYSREHAAYPAPWLRDHKFWPAVGRIDNVHGDRNLVCSCVGMEEYSS